LWKPERPEDYCFARAFGYISLAEGRSKWPFLMCKSNNRLLLMEKAISDYQMDKEIESDDHRVVQAISMKSAFDKKRVSFKNPDCVAKSWPQFWEFLQSVAGRV
jgi:hypothetical protein